MASQKSKAQNDSGQPPDARDVWTKFGLPPISISVPIAWYPKVSEWTESSARVRWESLTGTPLDINWRWRKATHEEAKSPGVRKRLETAWNREMKGAESQAKKAEANFEWVDESRSAQRFANLDFEGWVRPYKWNGQISYLAVLNLTAENRQSFAGAAISPPVETEDPRKVAQRILRSVKLAGESDPLDISINGLVAQMPPIFRIASLRGQDGQVFVDAHQPSERFGLARMNFSDLRLATDSKEKVWGSIVKILFDRGTTPDPIMTMVKGGLEIMGRDSEAKERAKQENEGEAVNEHEAGLFLEKRKLLIKAGDWVLRKLNRRWQGGAAALVWNCSDSHSIWGACSRSGVNDPEETVRRRASAFFCHGRTEQSRLNWLPFIEDQARPEPDAEPDKQDKEDEEEEDGDGKDGVVQPSTDPVERRREQLRFRVRALENVRLEKHESDGGGALIYQGAPIQGFLSKVLRGGAQPEVRTRRLTVDPVGRKVWEIIEDGASVAEVVAGVSTEFGVHPVETFPRLLSFMKLLGDRRLVEPLGMDDEEEEEEKKPEEDDSASE